LKGYFAYYQWSRRHLALAKDPPEPRAIMRQGEIIAIPLVGGLDPRYELAPRESGGHICSC